MCRTTNPGGGGSSPPVRANHRIRRNRGGDGACAEGHGYFVTPSAGMTTRHRVRCLPGTAIGVDAGERGYFFPPRRMGFGPVTALASCSAPLAAVVTSFAHCEAEHRGAFNPSSWRDLR